MELSHTDKDTRIHELEEQILQMKAREYDNVGVIQKQSEFEVRMLQMQYEVQQAHKDKKKAEEDLFTARDKLREVLAEKINIEN